MLLFGIVFFVFLAGLFAGAETGAYQLSRFRLRLGIEKGRLSFVTLGKVTKDRSRLLLSVLAGTNLSHYFATSITTFLVSGRLENVHTAELLATVFTAPVLFVFSELIPKNIFFYRADVLMPIVAPVLFTFHKIFIWSGMVPVLSAFSRLFAEITGARSPAKTAMSVSQRSHIRAILQETQEEGFLSHVQADIINRLAGISDITVKSVMTPISQVRMVKINADKSALMEELQKAAFTRLPVTEGTAAQIVGFINIYDCLSSSENFSDLTRFLSPMRKLAGDITVTEAINIMQKEEQKIVLVTVTNQGGTEETVGIVTMKDLAEEILGELAEW